VQLPNRCIKAATFEGMARHNLVTPDLIDFHRAVAAGGIGMTTLAYCAVSPDGQGAPGEIIVRKEAVPGLRDLVDAVHGCGAAVSIQLGHAGPVAAANGRPGLAPSRVFAPQAMGFTRAVTEAGITRIIADFARAAGLAVEAGFDAIELHFGHGYLVSAFLSPRLNRRTDAWGGNAEKRARLAREVATAVREAVGNRAAVIAKFNMSDGVKGGLAVEESLQAARLLERDGALDALQLTGGSSFQNPMYLFRGDVPVRELAAALPFPLGLGLRLTARWMMPEYPFEEAFFLRDARRFRESLAMPLILLGGINRIETVEQALAEGFEFVALGRALLREPGLVARWREGDRRESLCTHCNQCIPTIYSGTRCVLLDPGQPPTR
jgi:2,4-dienoyl-CoA reductase-like NADH-dependent reductase (Old Yellow Enzyme family)